MDNFIVSARKYRPTTFDSVIGQGSITNTLKNAIKNHHLAQAFLFCGPRGVGKTTCARILAKTINCEHVSENLEACDKCESCTSFNESHSFNIHELDAASNNSVDDIRNLIDQVRIAPQVGNYSIYIIDEVHMLSVAAFNAFLKTLEEPPSYAVFILATTSKQKIIPTILSRCQIFDFSRIQVEDIAHHLGSISEEQGVDAEPDALHIIAQKADGSLRDALSIFDQMVSFGGQEITYSDVIENLNILDYDYYFKAIEAILERDISSSLLLFDEVLNNGFDGHNYITGLSEHVRNLLVCKDEATLQLLQVGERIKQRYTAQAQACTAALLLDALTLTNKCDISYNTSINKRLHVELLLMQLCSVHVLDENQGPKVNIIPPSGDDTAKAEEPEPVYKIEDKTKQGESAKVETESEITNEEGESSDEKLAEQSEAVSKNNDKGEQLESGDGVSSNASPGLSSDLPTEVSEEVKDETATKESIKATDADQSGGELETQPSQKQEEDGDDVVSTYKLQTKSLKDFVMASGETEKKIEVDASEQYADNLVTQERLEEVWGRYAEQIKDKGKHSLYSTMTKRKPILKEDNIIGLDIDNSVQKSELDEEGAEIHEFLRRELDNGKIRIDVNVLKTKVDRKPYTSMEKFKRMAEKNPSIEKFREQLNLDID